MNSNTNTAAVLSLGAVGTILAYYGMQYFNEENENEEAFDKEEENNNLDCSSNHIQTDISNNLLENDTDCDKKGESSSPPAEAIKLEVSEQILSNKKNKWSSYWEKEYNNRDQSKQEIVVE